MSMNFMVPLRAAQLLFAILAVALNAYVASWYNSTTNPSYTSPSSVNFLIFASIFTVLLSLPYLTIAPRFFPHLAHKYGILACESVTMLFWLAGFLAEAVFMSHLGFCRGSVCVSARAAVAFSAMSWVLWTATVGMAFVYVGRVRGTTSGNGAEGRKRRFEGMDI